MKIVSENRFPEKTYFYAIASRAEVIVDGCLDFLYREVFPLNFGKKAVLREKMSKETLPKILTQVGKVLNDNGGKFMVGAGITYADICFGSALHGVRKRFGCQVQKERECYHAVRLQNRYIKATIRQPTRSQTQNKLRSQTPKSEICSSISQNLPEV